MKKHVLTDLSDEAWYVIIAVDDGDVVAFTEGQLILSINHEETGVPMTTKQQIKSETLDQLEEFGLIEHVHGEHLGTIRLTEAGKYWYGRKCKTDTAEFKRRLKNMPINSATAIPAILHLMTRAGSSKRFA